MIEINLIPDVKRELLHARSVRNAVVSFSVLIGAGALAVAVVLGLILGGQLAAESLQDGAIKDKFKELSSIEDLDKTVTIQRQLRQISQAHADKKLQSRLFDMLVAINPPAPNTVSFSAVEINPSEKQIILEGEAVNGYAALEVLKKTIAHSTIRSTTDGQEQSVSLAQEVSDGETSFGENAEGKKVLRFRFTMTYSDELFTVAKTPVIIATPTGKIDVTDSRLGVPDSLFKKKADDSKQEGN